MNSFARSPRYLRVWLWTGSGLALDWLWTGSGLALDWLWAGSGLALGWLWTGSPARPRSRRGRGESFALSEFADALRGDLSFAFAVHKERVTVDKVAQVRQGNFEHKLVSNTDL
jgi:hypothetical protein